MSTRITYRPDIDGIRAIAVGAVRISFIDDLCGKDTCRSTRDGQPLFADNNHIRYSLSPLFAQFLSRAVASLEDAL